MTTLVEWFNKEVLRWRSGAATAWSLILAGLFAFFFMTVATFSFVNPCASLLSCVVRTATSEFWLVTAMLIFSLLIHIRLNVSHFRVMCDIPLTRLKCLWSHIRPVRLLFIGGHAVACGIVTMCAAKFIGGRYGDFSYPCPQKETVYCLNETQLFIASSGCIYGMISAVTFFTSGSHVLRFLPVSQRKLFEVKGQLFSLFVASAKHSSRYLKYFYLAYYLGLGTVVQSLVLYQMDLGVDSDAVQLSTWRGLLDVSLLFYSWLAVLFADFLFSLPQLLFTVYYTEPSVFPIETTYELMHDKCLHNAISCNAHPLLQYLACLDLCRLSKFSPVRRQQVFSLSCLGGQPANWINIRTSCLEQLNCFIDSLISYGSTAHSDSLGTSYVGAPPVTVKAAGAKFAFPSSGLTPRITGANYSDLSGGDRLYTNLGTPVPVGDVTGMKTLTHRHIGKGQTASPPMQPPMEGRPQGIFSKLLCNFLVKVHQQRIIAYLVQETPENASRHLFADAQKYIFIVDGLSHIVCASLTEDMYGVVQSSLSVILSTLLDMLEAVDKHLKLCPISLRRPRLLSVGSAEQLDVVLRFALRASIKSAIYRIVATFRHHLNSVDLSIEHRRRLCSFEEFRE